ncbi:MAG: phosphotransferase [Microbacteriaceae bacterium]
MTPEPAEDPRRDLLESLAEELGFTLQRSRQLSVDVSGDGYVTGHEVTLTGSDGAAQSQVVYVETNQGDAGRDGVLTMRNDETGDENAVWLYPRDPALPALPSAVFPDAATVLLNRIGLGVDTVSLMLAAYRPGKRAVVRADWPGGTTFIKVVRPDQVFDLQAKYSIWRDAGLPVPGTLGWTDDGIIAFTSLHGELASAAVTRLSDAEADALVSGITDMCARIGGVPSDKPARASLATRLSWYERRVGTLLSHRGADGTLLARLDDACRQIERVLASAPMTRPMTIHGDLHLGQLFLNPADSALVGILDIDTAGTGDPADDAAALHAHLVVSAAMYGERGDIACARRVDSLADRWRRSWITRPDRGFAARARAISATHLIAHALGQSVAPEALVSRAHTLIGQPETGGSSLPGTMRTL